VLIIPLKLELLKLPLKEEVTHVADVNIPTKDPDANVDEPET
jgi:hypothetical protein